MLLDLGRNDVGRVADIGSVEVTDRFFIERFLTAHAADVRGRVLEVKDDGYARRFGGSRVEHVDILDIDPTNPQATIIVTPADHAVLQRGRPIALWGYARPGASVRVALDAASATVRSDREGR